VLLLLALSMLAACGSEPEPSATVERESDEAAALPTVTEELATATPPEPSATVPVTPTAAAPPTVPPPPATSAPEPVTPTPEPSLDEEPHATLGSPDAPVTIYEFSDFGCPSCRQFALFTFPTLREEYIDTGKVQFIYKDYPIVSEHGYLASQAAECAGEQGAYWEMHDQLFVDPAEWNESPEAAQVAFRRYAEALGLDAEALLACLVEERYRPEIDRDFEEGLDIGLFGTPSFIINRKLLSGAQPPEVFRDVIERELAEE
jgi:protein-disulfide isomerase